MSSTFPRSTFIPDPPHDGLNILLVEDGADSALSLALLLELQGHAVKWVADGPAALREVQAWGPDVVLLDLGLPKLSGDAVARRVRDMNLWKRPLLVAVTGYGRDADRARCQASGFDMHLVKPVDPEELFTLLRRFRSVLYA